MGMSLDYYLEITVLLVKSKQFFNFMYTYKY